MASAIATAAPVPVSLNHETAALVVLDITDPLCLNRPACVSSVPRIASLIAKARAAGARVIYTIGPRQPTAILDDVTPLASESVISGRADKFHETLLDQLLREDGTETLVLVGTSTNGAVLYTSFAANLRGYSVVVATDAVSADAEATTEFVLWQLLNQPGVANPTNEPLALGRVTLSTTELITFS